MNNDSFICIVGNKTTKDVIFSRNERIIKEKKHSKQ